MQMPRMDVLATLSGRSHVVRAGACPSLNIAQWIAENSRPATCLAWTTLRSTILNLKC